MHTWLFLKFNDAVKQCAPGASLVGLWLSLYTFNPGGLGSIPGQGIPSAATKSLHATKIPQTTTKTSQTNKYF